MVPFQNPYQSPYYSYQAPVQMPVQQNAPQQPPNRAVPISGRSVANESEITPQEIPMDGSMSLFPLQDGSCVIGKRWTANGTIETVKYVQTGPSASNASDSAPSYVNEIFSRLDAIEGSLNRLKPVRRTSPKKENDDE